MISDNMGLLHHKRYCLALLNKSSYGLALQYSIDLALQYVCSAVHQIADFPISD